VVGLVTEYGTVTLTCVGEAKTGVAGVPSNVTPPLRFVPKMLMISPGATGPPAKLAAFTTPAAVNRGAGVPIVNVTGFEGADWGFTTVKGNVAGCVKFDLSIVNWSVPLSTNVVWNATPFNWTTAPC
jgi:hypothetical protein